MQFDTKIAVVIRTDLEPWQKLNVASFLAGGIAASFPECIGEPYGDGSGTKYLSLIGQPILIYGADRAALSRALERALARNVTPAVYTEEMFKTTHDAANREVVRAVIRAELNLVGLAMRAERKVIDKIIDGLKFHGCDFKPTALSSGNATTHATAKPRSSVGGDPQRNSMSLGDCPHSIEAATFAVLVFARATRSPEISRL